MPAAEQELTIMAKKSTKETPKKEESKKGKKSEKRRDPKKNSGSVKIEVESIGDMVKKEKTPKRTQGV
jgi:hypothetical protein